jgi:hypothetical protein
MLSSNFIGINAGFQASGANNSNWVKLVITHQALTVQISLVKKLVVVQHGSIKFLGSSSW